MNGFDILEFMSLAFIITGLLFAGFLVSDMNDSGSGTLGNCSYEQSNEGNVNYPTEIHKVTDIGVFIYMGTRT